MLEKMWRNLWASIRKSSEDGSALEGLLTSITILLIIVWFFGRDAFIFTILVIGSIFAITIMFYFFLFVYRYIIEKGIKRWG